MKDTLAALQPLLRQKNQRDHLDRSLRHYSKTRKTLDELAVNDRDRSPIRPEYVAGLAFAFDGPAVVDVVTARQELSIPPAITVEQAKGFSPYAIRTILAGRGDELLDLITTNVARRILD